jgi:hypothetical protein
VIEIPNPPPAHACASCASPLVWLWSPRKSAWVSFVPESTNPRALEAHGCAEAGPQRSWRDLPAAWEVNDPRRAERARKGRALVDAVLAGRSAGQELAEGNPS